MGKFLDKVLNWFGIDNNDKFAVNGGKRFETMTPKEYVEVVKNGWNNVTKDIYNGMIDITENTTKELQDIAEDLTGGNTIQDTTNESAIKTESGTAGGIIDGTGENEEFSFQEIINKAQKEQWAREDEIRKETQAREDSAYQRAVEDMRKAGINPNLVGNVTPAQSGGGITQATGKDYTLYEQEIEKALTEMENILDRELKADENTKDRISSIIETIIQLGAIFLLKK